ncbi:MAG: FliG C-terminal domain-containing protein [Treponema sp.]
MFKRYPPPPPAAYAALQEHVLLFEDIAQLDDSSIQKLMREVNSWELARALKTASPALMGKIQRNMSARAFAMLKEEMDYMRPITMSDVREAEQRIIWILRHLIEEGSIVLPHKRKENLSTIKENDIGELRRKGYLL